MSVNVIHTDPVPYFPTIGKREAEPDTGETFAELDSWLSQYGEIVQDEEWKQIERDRQIRFQERARHRHYSLY